MLRRKITERGMVRPGIRLSDEVAVGALIEHGIVTTSDLERLAIRPGATTGGPVVDAGAVAGRFRQRASPSNLADAVRPAALPTRTVYDRRRQRPVHRTRVPG